MSLKNDLLNIQNVKNDIKSAIENKLSNSIDMNFINYPGYINNIPTGSGDVKLFNSIIDMQNSLGNQEGDLAIVYASTQANITEDTEFQIATFPQTVVLTTAVTDYIEVGFVPVESTGMFDCMGSLDSEGFNLDIYTDEGNIRVQYTSQDGLTYTRTTFMKDNVTIEGDELDFKVIIKFGSEWGDPQWDDRIGQFIITGSYNFDGLFQYITNIPNYARPCIYTINYNPNNNFPNYWTFNATNNYINGVKFFNLIENNRNNIYNTLLNYYNNNVANILINTLFKQPYSSGLFINNNYIETYLIGLYESELRPVNTILSNTGELYREASRRKIFKLLSYFQNVI